MKGAVFEGNSLEDLRGFPSKARRRAGFEIGAVQRGKEPTDWKPMKSIGPGVKEIRVRDGGQYRVIYTAKFKEAVYVLHAFGKSTRKTPGKEIDVAKRRYQALIKARRK